jgi:uncharacterized protein YkwD
MVKPKDNEKIDLQFKQTDVSVDTAGEQDMLSRVNEERVKNNLKPLAMNTQLKELARTHARDMFAKGYFAHENLEGKSPFDRMEAVNIVYEYAGENLALAPNTDMAHAGLMNSPGHRANILDLRFGKVGIGCIDGGPYGKMYVQEFTN